MRIRATVTAALVALAVTAAPLSASAAPRDNVLRGFCADITGTLTTSCVADASDDFRTFAVRDRRGHLHRLTTQRAVLRYLRHHAPACRLEDSPRCYWDAGHRGNGAGSSFLVIGGRHGGEGTAVYLEDIAR